MLMMLALRFAKTVQSLVEVVVLCGLFLCGFTSLMTIMEISGGGDACSVVAP